MKELTKKQLKKIEENYPYLIEYGDNFEVDVWESRVSIVFTNNIEESILRMGEIKGFNGDDYLWEDMTTLDACYVAFKVGEGEEMLVALFDYNKVDVPRLVHEMFHFTYRALKGRGINLAEESNETYAYTIQCAFKHTYRIYQDFLKWKEEKDEEQRKQEDNKGASTEV